MGFLSGSVFLLLAASVGSLAANIGLNTLQSWYDPLYADVFWEAPGLSHDAEARLAREEAEVDHLTQDQGPAASVPDRRASVALSHAEACGNGIAAACARSPSSVLVQPPKG
jgi:hypothetical protein